jgi:PIN domain nuclease of toxin-antitoxin system
MAAGLPMKLLLDTCALLALGEGTLPKRASKTLSTAEDAMVPAVVVWEIAIKVKTGKLRLPDSPLPWVEALCSRYALDLERQAPAVNLLCAAADLPLIHRDPFDRVLVATSLSQNLTILTSDRIIPTYPGVKTLW